MDAFQDFAPSPELSLTWSPQNMPVYADKEPHTSEGSPLVPYPVASDVTFTKSAPIINQQISLQEPPENPQTLGTEGAPNSEVRYMMVPMQVMMPGVNMMPMMMPMMDQMQFMMMPQMQMMRQMNGQCMDYFPTQNFENNTPPKEEPTWSGDQDQDNYNFEVSNQERVNEPQPSMQQAKKEFFPHHHAEVPRSTNLKEKYGREKGNVTTLMLRNIPNRYKPQGLMDEIDSLGFRGTYDFFYLPIDMKNDSNVGYAFVNMLLAEDASRMRLVFDRHRFKQWTSTKVGAVSPAHIQGLANNIRHFLGSTVTEAKLKYRPHVVVNGMMTPMTAEIGEMLAPKQGHHRRASGSTASTESRSE